jgi:hypothetical protein
MKNKLTKIIAVVTILFAVSGCTDNFINERTAPYTIDSETFFNSETDYYNALIGAYDLLQ